MPIQNKKDKKGPFYRFGDTGTKYYYKSGNVKSRKIAYEKALRQARAIKRSQNIKNQFKQYVF